MSENILEIKSLSKNFGGLSAVSNCTISVKKGSITGIIGPNGSGKTTLFNLIAGNLKSSSGNIHFNNEDITDIPSYELFSKGLLRTFQIAHEFSNLSVLYAGKCNGVCRNMRSGTTFRSVDSSRPLAQSSFSITCKPRSTDALACWPTARTKAFSKRNGKVDEHEICGVLAR